MALYQRATRKVQVSLSPRARLRYYPLAAVVARAYIVTDGGTIPVRPAMRGLY